MGDCGNDISGTYFETDGKTICKEDYDKNYKKVCSVCDQSINGTFYEKEGKLICADCYKKINGDNMDRKMCGSKVEGEIIRAIGFVFHPNCFKCCTCGVDLSNQEIPFTTDEDNRIYCQPCYNEKFAPRCYGCSKPIAPEIGETSAPRLTALGNDWHPDCFKCKGSGCGKIFNSAEGIKCYPKDNEPFCLECHQKG